MQVIDDCALETQIPLKPLVFVGMSFYGEASV